jgi:hypothetical protein
MSASYPMSDGEPRRSPDGLAIARTARNGGQRSTLTAMSAGRRPSRRIALSALLLAVALGAVPARGAAAGATASSAHPTPSEVLREPLWRLASGGLSTSESRQLMAGLVTDAGSAGPTIAVSIELGASATGPATDLLAAAGARVVNVAGPTVEAYVPPDRLAALAGLDTVRAIRPIRRLAGTGHVSPAVALHGSSTWQAAGLDGAGVKVGIIDGGFSGMAARLGSELPATVHALCYTSVGSSTTSLADCANGETHGTAVAEAIFDMAPGVSLYVADPISRLDEQHAITWMTDNGIRVINASFYSGEIFEGPGDGTSPHSNSLYQMVNQAVAGGALWVNAAGNTGDSGWTGPWADADNSGWLDFAPGVKADSMTLAAGDDVTVAIRWADPWGASANNYDLALYYGSTEVASSTDVQAGAGDPFEFIEYTAPAAGRYDIRIRRVSGVPTNRMQLMVGTSVDVRLSVQVADGTLPTPADSANPGMLAVGAVNVDRPGQIETYSSRGPTLDGRTKPDLVAADCAKTTIQDPFCGTSESAPFVTGAAAQVLQVHPSLTPTQLAAWLRSRALPLGSPVPNSTFGAGRLDLGALPFGSPASLAYAWPPTGAVAGAPLSGQPVVKVADQTGLLITAGPGSASDISVSLATNAEGATLSCSGGLAGAAVAGVASFTGCTIDRPGTGYVIQAEVAGLPALLSPPLDVLAAGSALPLTLSASTSTVTVGATAALTARFASAPATADRSLEIERSIDGTTWSSAGNGATDAAGTLQFNVQPTATGWYRVRFAGAIDLPAATSYPVRAIVRQSIALAASIRPSRTIARGTTVTFTSTVRPAGVGLPRATVAYVLYRRVGTAWVVSRRVSVTADSGGRARLTLRFGVAGSWYVRSSAGATSSNAASAGSAIDRYDVR